MRLLDTLRKDHKENSQRKLRAWPCRLHGALGGRKELGAGVSPLGEEASVACP